MPTQCSIADQSQQPARYFVASGTAASVEDAVGQVLRASADHHRALRRVRPKIKQAIAEPYAGEPYTPG